MECSPGSASSPLGQMWQKRKLGEVGVWVCALSHINWCVYLSLGVCVVCVGVSVRERGRLCMSRHMSLSASPWCELVSRV